MRQGLLQRRIPTVFALILLVVGIGIAVFVANNTTQLTGQAAVEDEPKNIQISNITDTSFTVSYTTDTDVLGSVRYGTAASELSSVETESTTPSTLHHITVSNLNPTTEYFFTITSGSREYNDNGKPFRVSTGAALGQVPSEKTVSGRVFATDGTPTEALVYLTTENGSLLSTKSTFEGTFSLNASSLRSANLSSYHPLTDNQEMTLSVQDTSANARAIFLLSQANPLPDITLSLIYNFTIADSLPQEASTSAETITFPLFRERATESQAVSIASPQAGEGFSDQQPQFEGSALPNEQVEIIIQSNHEIRTTVTADSNGNWEFRPDEPLEPGEHTLTVRSRDRNGILRILTRSFTVYAQGSQFTEPSVSPSLPTQTPTLEPTLSLTPTPSVTEQVEETPTPTETLTPTLTPTPTELPTPTPAAPTLTPMPTVEPTGSNTAQITLFASVVMLILGGFFFAFAKIKSL